MPSIVELMQERARLIGEARTMIDTAEAADRDFDGEESQTYGRIDERISGLSARIDRQRQAEQRDRDRSPAPDSPEPAESLSEQFRDMARGERRALTVDFSQAMRAAGERDLTSATDAAGGATVPETFIGRLYEYLTERSAIRQTNVNVLTTASGEKLLVPKVTAKGSASLVGQGQSIPENDPEFGQEGLDAHKYARMNRFSSELLADSAVDLLDFIARDAGRALGEATGDDYINGSGENRPRGILQDTTAGVTTAAPAEVDADELIDLFYSVIGPYRRNAYWMMNDSTISAVRKMKDDGGQYIFEPSLRAGTPDQILGRPVVTDHNMPSIEAGAKAIVFGDFSGYYIRDVGAMRFERSDHAAFGSDLVTFRSIMRTDGKLVDTTGAVKHLALATAGG